MDQPCCYQSVQGQVNLSRWVHIQVDWIAITTVRVFLVPRGELRTPGDLKQILNVAPQTRFTFPGLFFQLSPGGGGGGGRGHPAKYGKPYNLLFQLSDLHGKTVVKLQKVYRKDWENCRARGGKNNFAAARTLALHAHPAFGPSCSKPG